MVAAKSPCATVLRSPDAADIVAEDTVAQLGLGEPVAISAETGEGFQLPWKCREHVTHSLYAQPCRLREIECALWLCIWDGVGEVVCHGRPHPGPHFGL